MFQFVSILVVSCSLMAGPVVVDGYDQDVQEYDINYSCCNPLPIIPKEHCEQTWRSKEETIAYLKGSRKECIPPCQNDGDNLKIRHCVDCTAHNVCKYGGFTSEERIHYKAQACRSSQTQPPPQEQVGLLLMALLITRFFTN